MLVHRITNLILSTKTAGHALSTALLPIPSFLLLQAGDKCHSCYIFMKAVEESEEKFEKKRGIIIVQKQEKLKKPDEPSQLQQ